MNPSTIAFGSEAESNADSSTGVLSKYSVFLAALLIFVGAMLRIYDLGTESFWQDEVTMAIITSDADRVADELSGDRAPVFVILGHLWVRLFGTSEAAVRTLPMLVGTLSIGVLFLVGRELFDERVGLIAAFFMTFSGVQIHHSQDFRYYATLVLLTMLSFFFLVRALKTVQWRYFALYVIFSALMFYTHLHGIFVLAAQGLFFVILLLLDRGINQPRQIRWFVSLIVLGLVSLPFLWANIGPGDGSSEGLGMDWLQAPELTEPVISVLGFLFYGRSLPAIVIGAVVLVSGLLFYINRVGFQAWRLEIEKFGSKLRDLLQPRQREFLLVCLWFIIPIAGPFILSYILAPMFTMRYIMPASPAFYLLLGVALVALHRIIPSYLALGAFLIVVTPALYNSYYVRVNNEQWRESAAYVKSMEAEGDVIVIPTFDRPTGFTEVDAFDWYYDGQLMLCRLVYQRIEEPDVAAAFDACVTPSDRIWLVLFRHDNFPAQIEDMQVYFGAADPAFEMQQQADFQFISIYLFQTSP